MAKKYGKSYGGKRALWQWIILYLIIGGIVYAIVYYVFLAPKRGTGYMMPTYTTPSTPTYASPTATPTMMPSAPSGGGYRLPGY